MFKQKAVLPAIGAISLVLTTLILFSITEHYDGTFWITYVFTMIGLAAVLGSVMKHPVDNDHFASRFTLITISVLYLAGDLLCSVLFGFAFSLPVFRYFLFHTALFCIFLLLRLVGHSAVQHIDRQDAQNH